MEIVATVTNVDFVVYCGGHAESRSAIADTDAFQIAFGWNSNNIFYRRKQNDTWEPWVELSLR